MSDMQLDRRRHAFRPGLAAEGLRGRVEAERFVEPSRQQVIRAAVALRATPSAEAGLDTEALFGETVAVYDVAEGWAWGQLEGDGYVGYLPVDALSTAIVEPTHRVSALGTFLYARPDFKSPPLMHLSIGCRLAITGSDERYLQLSGGGYVIDRHVTPLAKPAKDFVEIAERLIGTPYLWGGRTRIGLDCSGLVQVSMQAAGLACPRDTDMQQTEVGADLLIPDPLDGLRRGDLVFWKGHVGIMGDGVMLVHANAHHMAVVVEPLEHAVARIGRSGSTIVAIRRPDALSAAPVGSAAAAAG